MAASFIYNFRDLDDLPISKAHRERLLWFHNHEGMIVPYSAFGAFSDPWLTSRAKGIYKPSGWEYSLSVKETLNSPYGDVPIQTLANGDWVYRYHRENGTNVYTNNGLIKCMEDGIPVGVIIQVQPKPDVRYFVAGLGLIRQFNDPWFDVVNWNAVVSGSVSDQMVAELTVRYDEGFLQGMLAGLFTDEPEDKFAAQLTRPNQAMFRVMLLSSYERTCAVTGSSVVPALEAAHIRPYSYEKIDHIQNGLLLRADVHRLFDRGLLGVDTNHIETAISPQLIGSEYEQLNGQPLILPTESQLQPSLEYLDEHRKSWGIN